jgi:hypothetical protein
MSGRMRWFWSVIVLGLCCGFAQRLVWIEDWGGGYYPPVHLSGDGRTVYISASVLVRGRLEDRIGRWREGEGWWYLRADGGLTRNPAEATLIGYVKAASYDGRVIVGGAYDPWGRYRPYRWRLGRGIEWLPLPVGALRGHAVGVSADGSIAAGNIRIWEGGREWWYIARWFADGRVEVIPDSRGLTMYALSADGRTIVGKDFERYYFGYPFRWQEGRGVEYPPGFFSAVFRAVSFDGRMIAGDGTSQDVQSGGAFRWVEGRGIEWLMPFRPYSATAVAMSWDGQVVVGLYRWDEDDYVWRSFVWREGVGWQDVYEAYRGLWPEWVEGVRVEALSANGRYLVGLGRQLGGQFRLFWLDMGRLGDVDGDGCVDDGDLLEVLFSFGARGMNLRGDLDGDGMVGESDLLEVLLHFGEGC